MKDRMTEEQREKASRLWRDGMSAKNIAHEIGVHTATIFTAAHNDRRMFPRRNRKLTDEQREEIVRLRDDGVTYKKISEQVGCSIDMARRAVIRAARERLERERNHED